MGKPWQIVLLRHQVVIGEIAHRLKRITPPRRKRTVLTYGTNGNEHNFPVARLSLCYL
jgi:hypothetical protein